MNIDTFQSLVQDYCQRAKLPAPVFDIEQCVLAPLPEQAVILAWDESAEEVLLLAPVGTQAVPMGEAEAIRLLQDAYLGQNLKGAAAGIDPDSGGLVIWRRLPGYGLTADRLQHYIGHTVDAAQAAQGVLG
ncbi:type III secretion system chaperone [Achromobacter xylosoxidans]